MRKSEAIVIGANPPPPHTSPQTLHTITTIKVFFPRLIVILDLTGSSNFHNEYYLTILLNECSFDHGLCCQTEVWILEHALSLSS